MAALSRRTGSGGGADPVLLGLLLLSFVLSVVWACATPIPIGKNAADWGNFHPDEISHIAVIEYTAEGKGLPPYQRPWDTSVHPPLYHAGVAAPVVAITQPVLGQAGALHLVRLLSALMGAGVVGFTYSAGRAFTGGRRTARLAAALVALIPMRVALAGAITNENLAALGAAGVCAAIAWGVRGRRGFDKKNIARIALWTLVGIGSKVTCLGLLPAAAVALWGGARQQKRGMRSPFFAFVGVCAVSAAGLGWWFVRNMLIYGDPFRSQAADRLWDTVQPGYAAAREQGFSAWRYATTIYLHGFASFWGRYDGMRRLLPHWQYGVLAAVSLIAVFGLLRWLRGHKRAVRRHLPTLAAWGVLAVWILLIYTQYNWRHFTPQGRYFFVLLVPIGVLAARGWLTAFAHMGARRLATAGLLLGLTVLNLWTWYVMTQRIGLVIPPHSGNPFGRV